MGRNRDRAEGEEPGRKGCAYGFCAPGGRSPDRLEDRRWRHQYPRGNATAETGSDTPAPNLNPRVSGPPVTDPVRP